MSLTSTDQPPHADLLHWSTCADQYYNMLKVLIDRLESLNEKRSGVVQMVKLAEKERDNLEVLLGFLFGGGGKLLKVLSYSMWRKTEN